MTRPEIGKTGHSSAGNRESGSSAPRHRRTGGATRLAVGALLSLWLTGCSILGGGNVRERSTIYAPDPRVSIDPSAPVADWQLSLSPPVGARSIDSFRIAVRPTPDELQVYRGAAWAKTPTDMLQDALLRALEDSGKLPSIARQGAGIAADYKLVIDLRRFEADYAGGATPAATVEFNAKLIHTIDQGIVDARTFHAAAPASGTDIPLVVDAFSRSLAKATSDLAQWILVTGDRHEREGHPGPRR